MFFYFSNKETKETQRYPTEKRLKIIGTGIWWSLCSTEAEFAVRSVGQEGVLPATTYRMACLVESKASTKAWQFQLQRERKGEGGVPFIHSLI